MKHPKYEEYKMNGEYFDYNNNQYNCHLAIEHDKKVIIQEAETRYNNFNELYDKNTLRADKVRVYVLNNIPVYAMITYIIDYKNETGGRYACGEYYPIDSNYLLLPHPYQGSICW